MSAAIVCQVVCVSDVIKEAGSVGKVVNASQTSLCLLCRGTGEANMAASQEPGFEGKVCVIML